MHELQATMQAKLQQIEMEQLEETQKKEEKDLRKRHIVRPFFLFVCLTVKTNNKSVRTS